MWPVFEYLNSSELVCKIQEWFGIKYNYNYTNNNQYYNNNIINSPEEDSINYKHNENNSNYIGNNGVKDKDKLQTLDQHQQLLEQKYEITNNFWYYLFIFGTELGDELFFVTIIPFWFWNIDCSIGRRVVFVWAIVMYIGQGCKEIICWKRPGYPVQRLQNKWSQEYGMPSTHAMVSISMPFSVILFMMDRYEYSRIIGFIISTLWSLLICTSRIYLGMHSVLDIIVGILMTIVIMIPLVPLTDVLDNLLISNIYSPLLILTISILMIIYFPISDKYTPTRSDTTMTIGVTAGLQIGAWLNYQLDYIIKLSDGIGQQNVQIYKIIWPTSFTLIGLIVCRTIVGLIFIILTRIINKTISYKFVCTLLKRNKHDIEQSVISLENKDKIIVDLTYKYFTCFMIGINTQFLLPILFQLIGINRLDFYTEI